MKRKNLKLIAGVVLASNLALLTSCGGGDKPSHDHSGEDAKVPVETSMESSNVDEDEDYSVTLPSPINIAFMFQNARLKFYDGLINPESNLNNYVTNYSKKLALGIYSGDFAYSAFNRKNAEAQDLLDILRKLSTDLNLGGLYDSQSVIERFENNISNSDSLVARDSIRNILLDIQMQSDIYFQENDVKNSAFQIFAGAWIECMYLGSNSADLNNNAALNVRLAEQGVTLQQVIYALGKNKENDALVIDLKKLEKLFIDFELLTDDDEDVPYENLKLDAVQIESLRGVIKEIRTKVING